MGNIPLIYRIQFFVKSLPGLIKYLLNILVCIITKQEIPRSLKHGDVIITKDGQILIFDSCDCPQDS